MKLISPSISIEVLTSSAERKKIEVKARNGKREL
jgi:hypothetical protein